MTQRRDPIRSRRYLDGSKGSDCTLRFDGCRNERETVVACHVHDASFGMARKADDLSIVDGCWRCHSALDLHTHGLPSGELYRVLFRALQETLRGRRDKGLLVIPEDAPKPVTARPTRKRAGRKIAKRNDWPPRGSRKIPARAKEASP